MLILLAHGSPNPQWRASVEQLTRSVQDGAPGVPVRLAYMESAPPSLIDVVADGVGAGAAEVRVLPLFLADEGHVERDIRPLVDEIRLAHPGLAIELLPSLGRYRDFQEFICSIAKGLAR
jgi:sirohydrochlorin cobaltochelatase